MGHHSVANAISSKDIDSANNIEDSIKNQNFDLKLSLDIKGVSKHFLGVQALSKIDLDIRQGEVHVLLGENGAGKSTLMKILSGAYIKDEGTILINGKPVEIKDPRHAQDLGISTIYQNYDQAMHLTVAENIFLGREPLTKWGTINWRVLHKNAKDALFIMGSEIDTQSVIRDLGSGQRQTIEIAKALSLKSKIILMDEPTASLTKRESDQLFKNIRSLKERGVSIIYVTHRLEEVKLLGDRVTILRDGHKIGTFPVDQVDYQTLVRLMVGRDVTQENLSNRLIGNEEILRLTNIQFKSGKNKISFHVNAGEIVAFAGLVGAGRTELIRSIFGIAPLFGGEVYIYGKKVKIRNSRDAVKAGMGFLTEDRLNSGLAMSMSVGQNITLPSLNRFEQHGFLNLRKEKAEVSDFIKKLNIVTPSSNQRVGFLSGGNQQKVVMAKWLMAKSRILFLDEPTQGIDVGAKDEVHKLIVDFTRNQGGTVIMISSDLPEVLRISDRILVMYEGKIVGEIFSKNATQELVMQYATGIIDDYIIS